MIISNEDVRELFAEIPQGHKHIRTTLTLHDGRTFTFQEATIANLVRAYTSIRTDPQRKQIRLVGKKLSERKEGYAEWQLVDE